MKKTNKKTKTKGKMGLIGAATIAGALGAYYFYGSKKAKENRAKSKAWIKKAEKEIISKAKKLKAEAINQKSFKKIADTVSQKYKTLKKIDTEDMKDLAKNINNAWIKFEKTIKKK